MPRPDTFAEVATDVAAALGRGAAGRSEAIRMTFGLVTSFDHASEGDRVRMVERRPPLTGDAGFDALFASLVEHLSSRSGIQTPSWVEAPERFVEPWWFVSGISRLHASALVQSPISFARHGVFICDGALSYA